MKLFMSLAICLIAASAMAQDPEIKIKKEDVFVDGNLTLKTKSKFGEGTTFMDLEGNELVYFQHYTDTPDYPAYAKIIFVPQKVMVTNQSLFLSRKSLISLLISNKVLVNGKIDTEQIEFFKLKYHEQVQPKQRVNIDVNE